MRLSENFTSEEMACRHCQKQKIDDKVIAMAQELRDYLGKPMHVTSGYRCKVHNANIGGVNNSYHTKGMALDFVVRGDMEDMQEKCRKLWSKKTILRGGLGIYTGNKGTFIHIDIGPYRIWYG